MVLQHCLLHIVFGGEVWNSSVQGTSKISLFGRGLFIPRAVSWVVAPVSRVDSEEISAGALGCLKFVLQLRAQVGKVDVKLDLEFKHVFLIFDLLLLRWRGWCRPCRWLLRLQSLSFTKGGQFSCRNFHTSRACRFNRLRPCGSSNAGAACGEGASCTGLS